MNEQRDLTIVVAALKRLSLGTSPQLPDEDQAKLASAILDIQHHDPDKRMQGLSSALDLITKSPSAQRQFGREIRMLGINQRGRVGKTVSSVLEEEPEIEPAYLYYCPEDPTHYRKSFFAPQSNLVCPLHAVDLELGMNG